LRFQIGAKTVFITPGSLKENGYVESFKASMSAGKANCYPQNFVHAARAPDRH